MRDVGPQHPCHRTRWGHERPKTKRWSFIRLMGFMRSLRRGLADWLVGTRLEYLRLRHTKGICEAASGCWRSEHGLFSSAEVPRRFGPTLRVGPQHRAWGFVAWRGGQQERPARILVLIITMGREKRDRTREDGLLFVLWVLCVHCGGDWATGWDPTGILAVEAHEEHLRSRKRLLAVRTWAFQFGRGTPTLRSDAARRASASGLGIAAAFGLSGSGLGGWVEAPIRLGGLVVAAVGR